MEPLLTVTDAARLLAITTRAVYELAEDRNPDVRLPAVRIGRRLRFRRVDLQAYVDRLAVMV